VATERLEGATERLEGGTERLEASRGPVRSAALSAAGAVALVGPTVLAFFSGGYFDGPRDWAGVIAWVAVLVALTAGAPLPRARAALLAIGGLGLLATWTLLSTLWAPLAGNAYHAAQIAFLYLGALIGSALVLPGRRLRLVEPVLALGALVVIGYGLAGRMLPGLLHFARSISAQGRLEQPLTYWNAMGELAALGFVLAVRMAGDRERPDWLRALAAAAAAPFALALWISFSRGALFACFSGLVALVVLAPTRAQLGALGRAILFGALAAGAAAPFGAVTSLSGSLSTRESQGALSLSLLVVLTLAAGGAGLVLSRRESAGAIALPARTPAIATAVIVLGLAVAIVLGAHESDIGARSLSGGATRLVSLKSNRYDYWSVALRAFAAQPLHGVGAGGWSVYWLRWRHVNEAAQDAHSLELQTLAELGLVGVVLLAALLLGVGLAARSALRERPGLAAGPVAGLVVYLAHSPLDWDWQMPALTLVAVVLGGAVLAAGEPLSRSRAPAESHP
jgi:O-antigen ligase